MCIRDSLGAMLSLNNRLLDDIRGSLDALAQEVMDVINRLHVQGVGVNGSFTEVTGVPVTSTTLENWSNQVTSGSFFVRVVDTATGGVTRQEITVDPTVDTITDIRDRLDAVDGLSASIVDQSLRIQADAGHTFDFLPAVPSQPHTSNITGDAEVTVSGIYEGQTNQTFTCTISGTGQVGIAGDLSVEVRNGAGELMSTVNVGSGYAAGDPLEIGGGISIAIGTGQLNDSDDFTIQLFADTDTSGFLSAAGINTLFAGSSAADIAVRSNILNNPWRFAGAVDPNGTDGVNVQRMIDASLQARSALDNVSLRDYSARLVSSVGQAVQVRRARKDSLQNVVRQLDSQRDSISGVDLNEETARLVMYERMFQAMSVAIRTQDKALQYLLEAI